MSVTGNYNNPVAAHNLARVHYHHTNGQRLTLCTLPAFNRATSWDIGEITCALCLRELLKTDAVTLATARLVELHLGAK